MNTGVRGVTDLVILNGPEIGTTLSIKEGVSYLGRSIDNDIRIEDKTISRKHLKIERVGQRLFVTDLSSSNGTTVNGHALEPNRAYPLRNGDRIRVGLVDGPVRIYQSAALPPSLPAPALQGKGERTNPQPLLHEAMTVFAPRQKP